jgi:hypothetical protein
MFIIGLGHCKSFKSASTGDKFGLNDDIGLSVIPTG